MFKSMISTTALALTLSLSFVPAAHADDKPFVLKLLLAIGYARDVVEFQTFDKEQINEERRRQEQEEQQNAPVGSLGIRG